MCLLCGSTREGEEEGQHIFRSSGIWKKPNEEEDEEMVGVGEEDEGMVGEGDEGMVGEENEGMEGNGGGEEDEGMVGEGDEGVACMHDNCCIVADT